MGETAAIPLALIGYKLTSNIMEHYTYPLPALRRFIQLLQREVHIPILAVEVDDEDDDEDPTLFVCCYAEKVTGIVNAVGLANAKVPEGFEMVGRMLKVDGGIRRFVCLSGRVYAVGIGEERAGWVWL